MESPQDLAQVVSDQVSKRATKIQDFPKGARIATVKALKEMEFSRNKIAKLLGMGKDQVSEYMDMELEDRWVQYQSAVKRIMGEQNDVLRYTAGKVIADKLQEGTKLRLYELTGLYKVLNDVSNNRPQHANSTLIQTINVHPSLTRPKAEEADLVD